MSLTVRVITLCALIALGSSAHADTETPLPAECYETTLHPASEEDMNAGDFENKEVQTLKKIHVDVQITQETDTSPIKLDASSSTVPSGKMEFQWNNKYDAAHTKPVLMHEDGDPGDHWQLKVRVLDVVCHTSELKIVPVRSR